MAKSFTEKFNIVKDYISESSIPIQTVSLANHLGLDVFKANFSDDSISGKIQKSDESESGFEIIVNTNHSVNRRRFTIAHEIGHYVFHEDKIGDGIFDDALYRSGLQNSDEIQADAFAADILMPRGALADQINELGIDLEGLSKLFEVSKNSMAIRLGVRY